MVGEIKLDLGMSLTDLQKRAEFYRIKDWEKMSVGKLIALIKEYQGTGDKKINVTENDEFFEQFAKSQVLFRELMGQYKLASKHDGPREKFRDQFTRNPKILGMIPEDARFGRGFRRPFQNAFYYFDSDLVDPAKWTEAYRQAVGMLPPQARGLRQALSDLFAGPLKRARGEFIAGEAYAKGYFKANRKDPHKIFAYYRRVLIPFGLIKFMGRVTPENYMGEQEEREASLTWGDNADEIGE